ncbi:MAG: DUF4340 domain-containing protein [Parasporobacterium sp.]|nr:DUF4340 domain-containing protein [Parasporobacterium sp.]
MEKKILKMIGAGVLVIILLAGALVMLKSKKTDFDSGVKVFVDKEPSDIIRLDIDNTFGSYSVYYDSEEDGYVFDDIPVNIVDVEGFFELMNHSCGFGSLKLVKEKAEDPALYGLEEPSAKVHAEYSDGSQFSLAIGNKEPVSGNYYGTVMSDGEKDNVYLFSGEDMIYFLIRKESYISYQVTPALQVTSPLSAVRDVTFSGTAFDTPIRISAVSGADERTVLAAKSFGPATHIVRLKGTYELDQTYGIEVLGSILGIRAIDVVKYNVSEEELKAMGFEKPYMQVDFSLKNGTDYIADYQLRLVPYGENYLAYMLGSGVVFVIEPPAFVSVDSTKLCLRWFLSPLRKDLENLTVEFDGESYIYTTGTDENGGIYAEVNGRSMDTELFFSFYRLVTSASSDGILLENPVNAGEPLMTITYNYNIEGKEPDVMKLYKGSLRRVNADINGVTEFDMKESFVEAVKEACAHTLTGETIEENW